MIGASRPVDNQADRRRRAALLALVALLAGVLCAACGGSSASTSSKPAYCSAVSDLETSVKALPSVDELKNNGVSALKPAVMQVQQDATTAVNEAKNAFASQTTALKNSINTLSSTATQLASTPTPQAIAQLSAQISAVATHANNLQDKASSTCP